MTEPDPICVCDHPASWHSPGRCHGTDEEHYLCGCRGLHVSAWQSDVARHHEHHERPRFGSPEEAREYVDNLQRYGRLRRGDESLVALKRETRRVVDVHLPPIPEDGDDANGDI